MEMKLHVKTLANEDRETGSACYTDGFAISL